MKNKTRNGRRTAAVGKLKRKVVGSGVSFGAALRGHPLPTRKQWDKVTTALGPCGGQSPETIAWVLNSYRRICGRLQECVQKHSLGMAGYHVDEIAVESIDKMAALLREIREALVPVRKTDNNSPVNFDATLADKIDALISPNSRNQPRDE